MMVYLFVFVCVFVYVSHIAGALCMHTLFMRTYHVRVNEAYCERVSYLGFALLATLCISISAFVALSLLSW